MPKFKISIDRIAHQRASFVIEAEDEDLAKDAVADASGLFGFPWRTTSVSTSEIDVEYKKPMVKVDKQMQAMLVPVIENILREEQARAAADRAKKKKKKK